MQSNDIVISARGLARVYRKRIKAEGLLGSVKGLFRKNELRVQAVSGFDLEVRRGEIVGLIGPNGAGKTTTIKMMTGIIRPTAGDVAVLGFRPYERKEAFQSRMALVAGQKSQLWWDLPARDSFRLNQAIYRIPEKPGAPLRRFRRGRHPRLAGAEPLARRADEDGVHRRPPP